MPILQPYSTNSSSITKEIKKAHSRVFRKAYIKRRSATTGLFESSWQEITNDIKRWGSIGFNVDHERVGYINFVGTNLTMQNKFGKYGPASNSSSLWYGYGDQQRTLVKIEAGYIHEWLDTNGIWHHDTYPTDPTIFRGIISGNINYNDENEVILPVKPLTQVFKDFPLASTDNPGGWYLDEFMFGLRDQTLGGSYVFRPFFDDTTSSWDLTGVPTISAMIFIVSNRESEATNVWEYLEQATRAFNLIPYITPQGVFKMRNKTVSSTTAFEFYGAGPTVNTEYGQTIKDVSFYGENIQNYYSKVVYGYNWSNLFDSTGPFEVFTSLAFSISGANLPWNTGQRILDINNENLDIIALTSTGHTSLASSICGQIFNEVSRLDEEIRFKTTFIPHLNLLDRVNITYDSSDYASNQGLWDAYNWDTELTWDDGAEGAIVLQNEPFKILSIVIDLDNLETNFVCRALNE